MEYSRESDIKQASMVALDPYLKAESLLVAQMCVRHHKPYITLDCEYDDFMAIHAAAVIISHELRDQAYPVPICRKSSSLPGSLRRAGNIYLRAENFGTARRDQPVKKYKTLQDQTCWYHRCRLILSVPELFMVCCIHGDDKSTVEFASAVAACVCLTVPHALNAPDLKGVLAFMKEALH